MKRRTFSNYMLLLVFIFFFASIFFHLLRDFSWTSSNAIVSLIGVLSIGLYWYVVKRFNLLMPATMNFYMAVLAFMAYFMGETLGFYERFPIWDTLLHFSSGFIVAALGYSLVDLPKYGMGPRLKATFAFSFSMMVGVVWEVLEFFIDSSFGTNMQRFLYISGEPMVGQQALLDTMQDFLECITGALLLLLLIYLKHRFKWRLLDGFVVKAAQPEFDI